jgi:hypothetical protein
MPICKQDSQLRALHGDLRRELGMLDPPNEDADNLLLRFDATHSIDAVQWDRPDNDPTSSNVGPGDQQGNTPQ